MLVLDEGTELIYSYDLKVVLDLCSDPVDFVNLCDFKRVMPWQT